MTSPSNTDGRKVTSLRELPQSLEPAHDLWPGIESQLTGIPAAGSAADGTMPGHRRAARMRWLATAAMVACIATGVWIGRSLLPGSSPGGAPAIPAVAPTAVEAAYLSDPRYQQQRAALVRALQARLAALPPPERDKVTASLEAIEKAKADLEQALGHDPSNELLVNTYQDEMRVLTDVHEASDPGRGI